MKKTITTFIAAVCLFSTLQTTGSAQNVYKDYVQDKYAQYSPFDHANRGLIYKMQTGHAGWFGKCDDDRQKMVSPYIDWHCRKPDACLPVRFTKDLFADIFKKSDRLRDSAGGCICGDCNSADCNGNCEAPIQDRGDRSMQNQIELQSRQRLDSKIAHARAGSPKQTAARNASTPVGNSSRGYFSRATRPEQIRATGSRSNDPRYGSGASPVTPAAYQRTELLNSQSQNGPNTSFERKSSPSGATAQVPSQSRTAPVNSTPVQDRKADPQHFQFQLIGGSTNR